MRDGMPHSPLCLLKPTPVQATMISLEAFTKTHSLILEFLKTTFGSKHWLQNSASLIMSSLSSMVTSDHLGQCVGKLP